MTALAACSSSEHDEACTFPIALSATLGAPEESRAVPVEGIGSIDNLEITVLRNGSGGHYFTDSALKGGDGTIFSFSTPHYWLPGASLDFYAYTPSPHATNVAVTGGAISFDYSSTAAGSTTDGADILTGFAYGLEYAATNRGIVPMKLSHALSLIEFAVAYEEDASGNRISKIGRDVIITALTLKGLAMSGSCRASIAATEWTHDAATDFVQDFTDGGSVEGLRVGRDIDAGDLINLPDRSKAFMVIPGQLLTTLSISFIEGSPATYTKTVDIDPVILQPGKRYVFNLAIKSNDVNVTGTLVTDWIGSGTTDITLL